MKSKKYIFSGQNASTGTPNTNTGRMSMYGRIYEIDGSKTEVAEIKEHFERRNPQGIVLTGVKSTMRQFCLGSSVNEFEQALAEVDTLYVNSSGDVDMC